MIDILDLLREWVEALEEGEAGYMECVLAADEIERLRAELEWTRQSWVNGDEPNCEHVCMTACKGPCEGATGRGRT